MDVTDLNLIHPDAGSDAPRLATLLADRIGERIAMGDYLPGSKLDELELAEQFGVSRTPVREALIQLGTAGVVTLRPRRGAVVTEVSPQRLMEMFDVMAELESMCARLAARRSSAEEREALRAQHDACVEAVESNDPDDYYLRNERFHHAIYHLSHNDFLEEQALALSRRLRPYRRLQLRVRARVTSSFAEHLDVVEAICTGAEDLAAERIRAHVTVQGARFADLLASLARAGQGPAALG